MTPKQDMARERTEWAEDRTRLAAERTFAGWLRTGLTIVVVAMGLQALFGPVQPTWLPKTIATVFLLGALTIFAAAWAEARASLRELDSHEAEAMSLWRITLLSGLLAVGTVAIGATLWLL